MEWYQGNLQPSTLWSNMFTTSICWWNMYLCHLLVKYMYEKVIYASISQLLIKYASVMTWSRKGTLITDYHIMAFLNKASFLPFSSESAFFFKYTNIQQMIYSFLKRFLCYHFLVSWFDHFLYALMCTFCLCIYNCEHVRIVLFVI